MSTAVICRNCFYCPFHAGRDFRRATFKPDELATTFMALHRAGLAQGTFLSSGITGGGVRTQGGLNSLSQLGRLGANTAKIAPFVLVGGRRPVYQHTLW